MSNDTIEINVIHDCPNVTFFRFQGVCPIKTCQYNTNIKEPGCMKMLRKEGTGKVTDAEICLFKHPTKGVRYSGNIKKKAVLRVKNISILYRYVLWIKDKYSKEEGLPYSAGHSSLIDTALASYPLNIPLLHADPWILSYLYNDAVFMTFISENVQFNSSEINLRNMLDLPPKKMAKMQADIASMCSKSFQLTKNSGLFKGI